MEYANRLDFGIESTTHESQSSALEMKGLEPEGEEYL